MIVAEHLRKTFPGKGKKAAPVIAVVRWRASGKMLRMRERVEGMIVAPPTPNRARAAIRAPALGAKAAMMLAVPKPNVPMSRRRRRPMRSATLPMVTSRPARVKE